MKYNKAKMYFRLQEWIETGFGTADLIVDAPYQNPDYAPYVVAALVKGTPKKRVPQFVLDKIGEELKQECEPKKPWYKFWKK
jgi:hypothetical protein